MTTTATPLMAPAFLHKQRRKVLLLLLSLVFASAIAVVSADVCEDCKAAAKSFFKQRTNKKCRKKCKKSNWAAANDCKALCCKKICNKRKRKNTFGACKKVNYCPAPVPPTPPPTPPPIPPPTPFPFTRWPTRPPTRSPSQSPTERASTTPTETPLIDDTVYNTVIVGAGAAGLSAGYTLVRLAGVDAASVKIVEAQSVFGGRVKKNAASFPEFPLDMGASFIQKPSEIRQILGNTWSSRTGKPPGVARTFKTYTWWDLFDEYVVPSIRSTIEYECVVTKVQWGGPDFVQTTCQDGRIFRSKHVVVTVSLQILKDGDIDFDPSLPKKMTINHPGEMWQGIKAFMEFSSDFVGNGFCMNKLGPCLDTTGENLWWDYSGVNGGLINGNLLLGGYTLGVQSEAYIDLTDDEILDKLADDLVGKFSKPWIPSRLVQGVVENWSKNPFFKGTLSNWGYACPRYGNQNRACANNPPGALDVSSDDGNLGNGRLFLAGEAFPTDSENGWVDAGAFSGDDAARKILKIDRGKCLRDNKSFWLRVADPDGVRFQNCGGRNDIFERVENREPYKWVWGNSTRNDRSPSLKRMNFGGFVENGPEP